MSSILDPLCCGYAKVAMFEIKSEIASNINKNTCVAEVSVSMESQYRQLKTEFDFTTVDYEWYHRNICRLRDSLQSLGKRNAELKRKIFRLFLPRKVENCQN